MAKENKLGSSQPLKPLGDRADEVIHVTDRSEREQAEESLHLFIAWIKDSQGRHTYLNKPGLDQIDLPVSDWQGKTDFELWSDDIAKNHIAMDQKVLKAGKAISFETNAPLPNGEQRQWQVIKFPIKSGNEVSVAGLALDVTQTKEKENALVQRQLLFSAFINNSPAISFLKDAEGRYIYFDETFEKRFGVSLDDSIGKTDYDFWPDEYARKLVENDRAVLVNGELMQTFEDVPNPDGAIRHYLSVKFPFTIAGGTRCVGGIAIDVTEQKRVQDELNREHVLSESIVETARCVILLLDPTGKVIRFNPYFEAISGWSLDEAQGLDWFNNFVPENERPRIRKLFRAAVGNQRTAGNINGILCKDGSIRQIEWHDAILRTEQGETIGLLCSGQDITDRRWLEQQLVSISEEEQRRIGRDLHDGLGQELTGLAMLAESLSLDLHDKNLPEASTADKIARLIENALHQIRTISKGMTFIDIESRSLASSLEQLANHVSELYGIKCSLDCDCDIEVDSDQSTHLFRIAQEAITNAVKHGKATEINLKLSQTYSLLKLQIADNGTGFQTSREASFSGLGIHTMRYRCDSMGGKFQLDSTPGNGTIVTCELPVTVTPAKTDDIKA